MWTEVECQSTVDRVRLTHAHCKFLRKMKRRLTEMTYDDQVIFCERIKTLHKQEIAFVLTYPTDKLCICAAGLEKKVRELYQAVCRLEEEKYDWEGKLGRQTEEVCCDHRLINVNYIIS